MPRRPRVVLPHVPLHLIQRGNNRQLCFVADDVAPYGKVVIARWIFLMNKNENRGLPPVCLVYLRPAGKSLINTNIYLRNKKWLF